MPWEDAVSMLHEYLNGDLQAMRKSRVRRTVSRKYLDPAIAACKRASQWEAALSCLRTVVSKAIAPSVIAFTTVISLCDKARQWQQALSAVEMMQEVQVAPDRITYNSAISACETGGQWQLAVHLLHLWGVDGGLETDLITWSTLCSACERGRAVSRAVQLASHRAGHRELKDVAAVLQEASLPAAMDGKKRSRANDFQHYPVMLPEVVEAFAAAELPEGHVIIDCTLGGGSHSEAILERNPNCRILGIDKDADALEAASQRLARFGKERVKLCQGDFADIEQHFKMTYGETAKCGGILVDCGVSSPQLDRAARGFGFRQSGPLDMRMDPDDPSVRPASWYVKNLGQEELAHHLRTLADEVHADLIASRIRQQLPQTTQALRRLLEDCVPKPWGKIHPGTKTFQALRMLVNGEMTSLQTLLGVAPFLLEEGGLLCIITFHGVEDTMVRRLLRGGMDRDAADMEDRPFIPTGGHFGLQATPAEVEENARSRSAKLRIGVRTTRAVGKW